VVDELALLLEPDLDAKNLTLSYAGLMPNESVRADRELLRQALFNLIQNAVQASPDGQTVEVLIRHRQDRRKRIEVTDHGPGVSTEVVDSLFAPYFTTRQDGTGLGLAIVRQIASAHGWEAGYTPRPGGGSKFRLDRIHD
jgi:signal transduction histidine kinase